jgi:hypothetical protein
MSPPPPPPVCSKMPPNIQCWSQGKWPVRSQMLKEMMRKEPTVMRNIMTDICPNKRTDRVGESVYLPTAPVASVYTVCTIHLDPSVCAKTQNMTHNAAFLFGGNESHGGGGRDWDGKGRRGGIHQQPSSQTTGIEKPRRSTRSGQQKLSCCV